MFKLEESFRRRASICRMSKMISLVKKMFSKDDKKQKTGGDKNMLISCTTVVAIKFGNGVVLGADGRIVTAQFGRVAKNLTDKTLQVGCSAVGFSGNTEILFKVQRRVKREFVGRAEVPFTDVVSSVRKHMTPYADCDIGIELLALVIGKNSNDTWSIVELKLDTKQRVVLETEVNKRYAVIGSGQPYVKTFLKKPRLESCPEDSALEQRTGLAFSALKHAVKRDHGTGGLFRVISIIDQKPDAEDVSVEDFFEIQPNGPHYCMSEYVPYTYDV